MTADYPTGQHAEGYQPFPQDAASSAYPVQSPPPPYPPYAPYSGYPPPDPARPGYPYYPGPVAPSTNGYAIASLALSVSAFVLLPLVGSILGVIFGHIAQNQIRHAVPPQEGRGLATAGLIVGYIGIGIFLLVIALFLFILIVSVAASSSGSS
jgi:hypothetical protein